MSNYTLGKPNCPTCKGDGVFPGPPRRIERISGPPLEYPTVVRCSCLEKPIEETESKEKPDAARRRAGDTE
jgi:hypothetical protein